MIWCVKSIKKFVELWIIIGQWLILVSIVTGCVSISTFASLIRIPIGITSSAIGLKICIITAGIRKHKSIIKKKKKTYDKTALLSKSKLNSKKS